MPVPNVDAEHLARLRDYWAQQRSMPSYAGISDLLGFKTKNAAVKLGDRLVAAGYLRRTPGGKLAPAERFFELPMVDAKLRAGQPDVIEAQERAEVTTLESVLIDVPSETVLIRVKGDSMRDAGVLDGDLAIVQRAPTAQAGEFVAAIADDAFTVKELRYEGRQAVLVPHNPECAIIRPRHSLQIFGVVRGILRKYRSKPAGHRRMAGAST